MSSETIGLLTIPLFSAAIGYVTNWTGIWMLFNPVRFAGFTLPGLKTIAQIMPRRIQQIPGIMVGGVGWQGIIPSRAAKMGSIAVDKGIAKLGNPSEFYERIDPEKLADYIVESSRGDIRELVEDAVRREHPQLWRELTPEMREGLHSRVERQFPEIVHEIFDRIGSNIDQLLDVKLMVIRRIEESPELANKIFKSVGDKELRLIINMGFVIGFALGIPVAALTALTGSWVLLVCGPIVGWVTNWVAILMIFEPVEPRRIMGIRFQGMFLRRQQEVADIYAGVIADDIVTVKNMGEELLHGANSDRTRRMIADALRPAIDRSVGSARPLVRLAVGPQSYDAIRETVAQEGVEYTITPLSDPDINRRQSAAIRTLLAERMREMESEDFSDMLRSAIRQDEWLLLAHGGVLGVVGGALHLLLFA
ncbi:MAG: hypothetical protein QOD53_2455 [Thermoleophilaceae bacterium]|jgi:uncharacterized membrane protein YheB (UPF0754 family)|nr:hypothetical protein [Thermoleophilaceae bacterium]